MKAYLFQDLLWILERGMERGRHLLSTQEIQCIQTVQRLSEPEGRVYAKLWSRTQELYSVVGLEKDWGGETRQRVSELVSKDLLFFETRSDPILHVMKASELHAHCQRRGLKRSGLKSELILRLQGVDLEENRTWIGVKHRTVLTWMAQWAFLRKHPPVQTLVLERLGRRRWPQYRLTLGRSLFQNRAQLLKWWDMFQLLDRGENSVDDLLRWLPMELGIERFSLRKKIVRELLDALKKDKVEDSIAILLGILEQTPSEKGWLLFRLGRFYEQKKQHQEAYELLATHRDALSEEERRELMPMGRRLGKKTGLGWAPERPMLAPKHRTLALPLGEPVQGRPGYFVCGRSWVVEGAVITVLERAGRAARRAEGTFLATLYGLLFSSVYFLPIQNALPVPYLMGPTDVGEPQFYIARQTELELILDELELGRGEALIRASWEQWNGTEISGIQWKLMDVEEWCAWIKEQDPFVLRKMAQFLLLHGFRCFSGFPDLIVFSGPSCSVSNGFPKRVVSSSFFVEVKGPSDSMSERQRVWMDRLQRWGATVELWNVVERKG